MNKVRILLVDDDADILAVFKKGLERNGFEVDAFDSPVKAIENFKPYHYSIVVTDVRMPEMTGFELYKRIRRQDDKVKVYFVTAYESFLSELRGDSINNSTTNNNNFISGVSNNSIIHKPVSIPKLVSCLQQ